MGGDRPTYSYKHPHPAVAVDVVIFTVLEQRLQVLLVERGVEPYKNRWALPGGFVRIREGLLAAAARELREETGVAGAYLQQVGAFGAPDRDPRERVISVGYFAILSAEAVALRASTDAVAARWWPFTGLPQLAFDHPQIIGAAHAQLVEELSRSAIAFQFLGEEFTLTELQLVHEAIRGEPLDKRNFRKWVATLETILPTARFRRAGQHRPARLYRLRRRAAAAASVSDRSTEFRAPNE